MKGLRAAREVNLTRDPVWRDVVRQGLALYTWTRGRPSHQTHMLPDALEHLAVVSPSHILDVTRTMDFSQAARQGAVRLSAEAFFKAEIASRKLSATPAPPPKSEELRWLVLSSLATYSSHLIAVSGSPPVLSRLIGLKVDAIAAMDGAAPV